MTKPKQTPLQRDVEYALDAQIVNRTWGRRFLRRLVREAIAVAASRDDEMHEDNNAYWSRLADRIARELVPSKGDGE